MHEIKIPQLGQSVEEASIVKWFKNEGDLVKKGEPLFSVQTDKAEIECESTADGLLRKVLVEPDVFVPVMTVVALVGDADEPLPNIVTSATTPRPASETHATVEVRTSSSMVSSATPAASTGHGVSPRAKSRAKKLRVSPAIIAGTGVGGRVMEADVLAYAERTEAVSITPTAKRIAETRGLDVTMLRGTGPHGKITKADVLTAAPKSSTAATTQVDGGLKRVPLTSMRRIIATRMCESKFSAPHYYVTIEIDMSAAVKFRKANADFTPSYNDLVMAAASRAIQEHPQVNARWVGDAIEVVSEINLGFAVALPTGLVVPVVRNVQSKSLQQLSAECKTLAEKARNGKLLPDDYAGNTFTISNLGVFGVDHFTAIINQPDSAILAVGQMKDRPVVIDGGIHIRPIMKATLSSDHRVIDGAVAAQFMGSLKERLEKALF